MVQIENLPLVLTGLGLTASVLYYTMVLRNANKTRELQLRAQEMQLETRQAQMFMQIYNQSHNDPSFIDAIQQTYDMGKIESMEDWDRIYTDKEKRNALNRIAMFYEGLGVLVREGYVDIRLVALLMTGMTRTWWENVYKSIIIDGRKKLQLPRWMSEAEYLYNELMKYIEEYPELAT